MSEEVEKSESTGGSIKNILIGLVSTITLGVGGWFTTKLTGGSEEKKDTPVATSPVININNTQQQSAGKTVIVNGGGGNGTKSSNPAPAPKPKPKKEGDEFKEEAPKW
jgi:hypothetical protein